MYYVLYRDEDTMITFVPEGQPPLYEKGNWNLYSGPWKTFDEAATSALRSKTMLMRDDHGSYEVIYSTYLSTELEPFFRRAGVYHDLYYPSHGKAFQLIHKITKAIIHMTAHPNEYNLREDEKDSTGYFMRSGAFDNAVFILAQLLELIYGKDDDYILVTNRHGNIQLRRYVN